MRVQPTTLRSRLSAAERELREDESGAMMVIGLFFALFLVGALYYLLGIGQAAIYRERMQDAADTAAFAGAVVKARAMNFIALINMIMAMLLAILIAIYAIYLMLAAAGYVILPGLCAAGWVCWPCAAACPFIGPTINAANMVKRIYEAARRVIEPIIKAGSKAGEAISQAAPAVSAFASYVRVDTTYKPPATFGISLGNPPIERLPSRKAPFSELCRKAKQYANWPFDKLKEVIPIIGHIIGWIGGAFIEASAAVVCEGSTTAPDLRSIGRSTDDRAGRPAFILPRTVDQNNCLLNGDEAACNRFRDWQERSRWDQMQGICQDVPGNPVGITANLPAGATQADCSSRVDQAASTGCLTRGTQPRYDYLYTIQRMRQTVRKENAMAPAMALFPASIESSTIRGPEATPLCGENGRWDTRPRSTPDLRNDQCLEPNSIRVDPPLPPGYPRPTTIEQARQLARQALDESGAAGSYIVQWTRVYNVLGCKEDLPPRNAELPTPVGGGNCEMSPQWVMPQTLRLGDEPFQVWGLVLGQENNTTAADRGVRAANRFRDGGNDIGELANLAQTLGRFSFAQAEFYYDGPDAGDIKEWLWNMGWTARMRRVRMPRSMSSGGASSGVNAAGSAAGGGAANGGGGFSAFSLNGIADRLFIH
jgi:hypothetical protein